MTPASKARIIEHLVQWRHNRDFIQQFSIEYADWIVTGSLYLTLHAIEALLTVDGARSRSCHSDRLKILQSETRYAEIHRHFHVLYNLAHVTRYSASPSLWVPPEDVEKRIVKELIYPIERSVRKLLEKANVGIKMEDPGDIAIKAAE